MSENTLNTTKNDFNKLTLSEWSNKFETLMRNRLIMGAYRYGVLNNMNKPTYNRVESMINRLRKYEQTGNTEFLVDVANLCMLEFEEGVHPNKHFSSIDDGEHVGEMA